MQITLEQNAFARALSTVQGTIERRAGSIPILSHVLIETGKDSCAFVTTNLDMEIRDTAPAAITKPGKATVSAQILHNVVRQLPEGAEVMLTLEEDGTQITLRSDRFEATLNTLPIEDFPDLSAGPFPHSFSIPAPDLRRLIDKTRFASSADEGRYYLNGIYLHVPKGKKKSDNAPALRAVATDGHRLACADCALPAKASGMPGIIIPRKTILEIRKLLENNEDEVSIAVSKTMVRCSAGGASGDKDAEPTGAAVTSKLVDGTFPDYARVIPEGNNKVLVLAKPDFERAVRRVASVMWGEEGPPLIRLSVDKGKLTLRAREPEVSTGQEACDVDYTSDPIDIGFNAGYLLEIVEQISEETRIEMSEPGAPTILRDGSDKTALYVLMPMRV